MQNQKGVTKFDLPWIAGLRDSKRKGSVDVGAPPSFYEADLQKWTSKFDQVVKDRKKFKAKYLRNQELYPSETINPNTSMNQAEFFNTAREGLKLKSRPILTNLSILDEFKNSKKGQTTMMSFQEIQKKRQSRGSTRAPTNIDFEYIGNANQFAEAIKDRSSGGADQSKLNFQSNLRKYKSNTEFKAKGGPWMYPGFQEPSVGASGNAGKLPMGTQLTDEDESRAYAGGGIISQSGQKWNDKVKNANANQFIHVINDGGSINMEELKWCCGLRVEKRLPGAPVWKT